VQNKILKYDFVWIVGESAYHEQRGVYSLHI
jgi:hypothetical protein